jgi:hypothetical protein
MEDLDAFVGSPHPLDFLRSWFGKKAVPTVSQLKKKFPTLSHDFLAMFGSSMRQDEYTRAEVLVRLPLCTPSFHALNRAAVRVHETAPASRR